MGYSENIRGGFAEEDPQGRLVIASETDESLQPLGAAHDTQPGDLPDVAPRLRLLPRIVESAHFEADDN